MKILTFLVIMIYAELSGDFPLGDSRQPTYKSLRPLGLDVHLEGSVALKNHS